MVPKLLPLDTETTDIENGRLVELACAVLDLDNPEDPTMLSFRVRPLTPISYDAMATHHITETDVINLLPFREHPSYQTVKDMVKDSVLIAHNAPFDIEVLEREGIEIGRWIDTKRLAMHLIPDAPKYNLQFLRYYLGCSVEGLAHSAEGDVRVLIAIFRKLAARITQEFDITDTTSLIEKAIELSTAPVILTIVPYRLKKWKGKTFSELNHLDRSYLEWAWKQDWSDLDIAEDLKHTLDYWMKRRTV